VFVSLFPSLPSLNNDFRNGNERNDRARVFVSHPANSNERHDGCLTRRWQIDPRWMLLEPWYGAWDYQFRPVLLPERVCELEDSQAGLSYSGAFGFQGLTPNKERV
jgi:hypothetical protein